MPTSNNRHPLRIAFIGANRAGWVAGTYYLRNLLVALRSLAAGERPETVLLVSDQEQADSSETFKPYVDQFLHMPADNFLQRQILRAQRRLNVRMGPEPPLASYLRAHQIDALFAAQAQFGPQFSIPLLTWIPDFQHLHLPEMFSVQDVRSRNRGYSLIANYADCVILSSQTALHDFAAFVPSLARKARVVPFVAQVPADVYASDPAWVCERYNLPRRFVYLPNQFWKHKNHSIVVRALALVKAQHSNLTIVCTGNTKDYRNPLYFTQLQETISVEGLSDNLLILGMIPHDHVFQLMRQSLAILKPSLFEGWSTTVEEAKSIGKQMILSEIPVHREQSPPRAIFFDPGNPGALAAWLVKISEENPPGPDYELEAAAREQLPERTREFGRTVVELVREFVPD